MKELIKKLNLEDFFRIIKNDKFEYAGGFKGFPELKIGLLDSYLKFKKKDQSERDFRHDYFKNSDVYKLFEETSKIREDFLKLDKSIKYIPMIQCLCDPNGDNSIFAELGYLSSTKSHYSFLISAYDYNMNFTIKVFKVFENIKKEDFTNLHLSHGWKVYDKFFSYYMFNNKWRWNLNSIKNDFVKNLLPKKHCIIHLCLCDEKKINKRKWNPKNLEKNEDYKFIE